MESAEFLEREVKMVAVPNSLKRARSLARWLNGKEITGCGIDCYWKHTYEDLPVVRHRYNDGVGQLTIKAQRDGNLVREEVNLELASASLREVTKLLQMQGYAPVLEIAKVSHNWITDLVVLSWYSVMDTEGTMLYTPEGVPCRFFEIELREDIDWSKRGDADAVIQKHIALAMESKIAIIQEPRSLWQLLSEQK